MFEINGKYNLAKIYASVIEDSAKNQINRMLDQQFSSNSNIAIMPDTHSGTGCVIGFTQTITDKVVPNLVGVDVGCGMLVLKISKKFIMDLPKMDKICHQIIPSGMNHRKTPHTFADNVNLDNLICPINKSKALLSIGTLGGGNHFEEIDIDENGDYYIVIHSGSRHLGLEVAKYWQDKAIKYHSKDKQLKIINHLKEIGREDEIQSTLDNLEIMPNDLAYLEGEDLNGYLNDMKIAQEFALWNREAILKDIVDNLGIKKKHILDKFCTIHNYIDLDNMILRKGAISLQKDEAAIIPINMKDGSLIVKGKGNKDWNYSGPHGAGRLMSRTAAKETLKMEDYKESMKDIYTTCVSTATIDEAPMAYKDINTIKNDIADTAEIITTIKPIYNFKAAE